MRGTIDTSAVFRACRFDRARWAVLFALLACWTAPAAAWMDAPSPVVEMGYNPSGAFITHGEYPAQQALAERLRDRLGWQCEIPELGDTLDLF